MAMAGMGLQPAGRRGNATFFSHKLYHGLLSFTLPLHFAVTPTRRPRGGFSQLPAVEMCVRCAALLIFLPSNYYLQLVSFGVRTASSSTSPRHPDFG